jgi:SnoaL-like domain
MGRSFAGRIVVLPDCRRNDAPGGRPERWICRVGGIFSIANHQRSEAPVETNSAPVDIAVAFTEAWGTGDLTAAARYVADDVTFDGPMTKLSGASAYMSALGTWAEIVDGVRIVSALGDNREAMLLYEMDTRPFGVVRAAERFVVREGRIASDTLVFDTHGVRAAASD